MKKNILLLQLLIMVAVMLFSCAPSRNVNYTGNETRAEKPCKKKVVFGPSGRRHRGNYGLNY